MIGVRKALALALIALALALHPAAHAADTITAAHAALDAWRVDEADALANRLAGDASARAEWLRARIAFERSDYATAIAHLNRTSGYVEATSLDFRPFLYAAAENVKGFAERQSAHFIARYQPGKDEVMVEAALETLERAREAVAQDLGYAPPARIVVEIYPRPDMLSRATGLSLDAIRTTGTIAICKWNRVMLITPRASLMGYSWRDTLNHEYTHLIISRVSANHTPIWLHEGIAKFCETRWRSASGTPLEPTRESLLARALRENKLVTLQQMSPSMSLLPSQQHGALAYTEVLSMIRWLTSRMGRSVLPRLLKALAEQPDLDTALRQATGMDTDRFQAAWMLDTRRSGLRELAFDFDDYSILFGKGEQDDTRDLAGIRSRRGRQYMTLGKLLKDRQHPKAAAVEFEKASRSLGDNHPVLQNYVAESLLGQNRYAEVLRHLLPTLQVSPTYLPTHLRLAEAYVGLGQFDKALEHLDVAFAQNPFDPRVYAQMALCADKLGRSDLAAKARAGLEALRQGQ